MKAINSRDFETAASDAMGGWLWDDGFSVDYTVPIGLSVDEMRWLANVLRARENRSLETPQAFSEAAAERSHDEPTD